MARQPRKLSNSGFYHVVFKGNGGQIIFWDDADRRFFLSLLRERVVDRGINVIAWCLMSNHVHLLIETTDPSYGNTLGVFMGIYAQHVNRKNDVRGHLLQDRFYSSPIESDEYLLDAVRYIHDNPQLAGICQAHTYRWSSYREYVGRERIASTALVLDMLDGQDGFVSFSKGRANPLYWFEGTDRLSDAEALALANRIADAHETTIASLRTEKQWRIELTVADMLKARIPITQLARLTGIGRSRITTIQRRAA